ncbi:hypothetical protein Tco_0862367 [Tanacetum coccineum]
MADLTFADSHNMVAYLEKSKDNADFAEIVDFLNASPIRTIVIIESSMRRDLHFNDEDGITFLTNTEIFENHQLMGSKSTTWNEFSTNIASAVICLAKKQKFNFSKLIFDALFNDEYDIPSHTKKVFANMKRQGKAFLGTVTPLFATMLIQSQAVEGEGSEQPTKPQHTHTTASPSHVEPIPIVASSSQPKKTQKHRTTKRKATKICQSSGPTTLVVDETIHEERGDSMERAATTATSLDAEQDSGNIIRTQSIVTLNEPTPQGTGSGSGPKRQDTILRDRPEDASKQRRNEIDQDEGISWFQEDAETRGRYGHDIEINTASTSITTANINITTAKPVTTASAPITTAEPKKSKEKGVSSEIATTTTRGVTMQEPSESGTRKTVPPPQHDPKDKGKAKMIKPEKPLKKKDQIKFDEEMAKRLAEELQAELEKEERVTRQREEEANLIS